MADRVYAVDAYDKVAACRAYQNTVVAQTMVKNSNSGRRVLQVRLARPMTPLRDRVIELFLNNCGQRKDQASSASLGLIDTVMGFCGARLECRDRQKPYKKQAFMQPCGAKPCRRERLAPRPDAGLHRKYRTLTLLIKIRIVPWDGARNGD